MRARIVGSLPPEGSEVWWRADDKRYANYDPWAEYEQPSGSHLMIELTPYIVTRHTPKGVFVRPFFGGEQFVRGPAKKQLAVPTKALALQDLVRRKERHVAGAEARAAQAREHLEAAKKALGCQNFEETKEALAQEEREMRQALKGASE